jgi:hypothetical protein
MSAGDVAVAVGGVAIATGLWLIYIPAALIAAGLIAVVLGLAAEGQ